MRKFEITMMGEKCKQTIEADGYRMTPSTGQFYKGTVQFMELWKMIDGTRKTIAMVNASSIKLFMVK